MIHDIIIPPAGESITSAAIARWFKNNGVWVEEGELLVSLETDKVSSDLYAPASGSLKILVNEGEEVSIGAVIGTLNDEELRSDVKKSHDQIIAGNEVEGNKPTEETPVESSPSMAPVQPSKPVVPDVSFSFSTESVDEKQDKTTKELPGQNSAKARTEVPELFSKKPLGAPPPNALAALAAAASVVNASPDEAKTDTDYVPSSLIPQAKEPELTAPVIDGASSLVSSLPAAPSSLEPKSTESKEVVYGLSEDGRTERVRMTPLRRKVAAQLVAVQTESAILTTFNECDMSAVMKLRKSLQEDFVKRHGVKLGFMSFFVKAVVNALKAVPEINAQIDGNDIVKKHYYDISVAVGTDKGLVVPVLRDCDKKTFGEIERELAELAEKARTGKITMPDLQGGVFTISNGGVYGSLLSTPIINPPQSGIMGLHAIKERPIAENGQVVIRPMMYLALSYDHRLVDGKQAVTFLVKVKECIEDPTLLLLDA